MRCVRRCPSSMSVHVPRSRSFVHRLCSGCRIVWRDFYVLLAHFRRVTPNGARAIFKRNRDKVIHHTQQPIHKHIGQQWPNQHARIYVRTNCAGCAGAMEERSHCEQYMNALLFTQAARTHARSICVCVCVSFAHVFGERGRQHRVCKYDQDRWRGQKNQTCEMSALWPYEEQPAFYAR